jgi:hypothetical protein
MTDSRDEEGRRRRRFARARISVDAVALVLAFALALAVILLMVVVMINVIDHQTPTQTLGENATQVIIAITGGLIGVLGGYIGARTRYRDDKDDKDSERRKDP